jgi:phage major head subunit gpT-like protein
MGNQYQGITSKNVIGTFYARLAAATGAAWVSKVAMYFNSTQETENYKWLGMVPAMREWVGGRNAKGFRENGVSVTNKKFEATIDVNVDDLRRDKTGQLEVRIGELARRATSHWASLLSTLIINGESYDCYDGQYFFDTDHSEGKSGTQSNDLSVDISALPCSVHGSTTVPSKEEASQSILQGVAAIVGFKDDMGEPMNEDAKSFVVMAAPQNTIYAPLQNAILGNALATGVPNEIQALDYNIILVPNARLSDWTDCFAIFRVDADVKAFIQQEELGVQMSAKAEGSEYEFDTDKHQYGIKASRNVAYGYWQEACLVTLA